MANGEWRMASGETSEQLATLRKHFPTPRDAVGFILDQFPLVRQKDEQAHGRYRTRERILEIYDAMLAAQRSGRPYQTALDPPPGEGPRAGGMANGEWPMANGEWQAANGGGQTASVGTDQSQGVDDSWSVLHGKPQELETSMPLPSATFLSHSPLAIRHSPH
jgi:hypothetical protein